MAFNPELSTAYKDWTRAPERGSPWLLALIVRIARCVPRRLARGLMYPIVLYFVLFSPRQVRASRQFLRRALPRPPRWADVYRHYLTFSWMVLDRVYWLSREDHGIAVQVHDGQIVEAALRGRSDGLIVLGSHLGSFEALRGAGELVSGRRVRPLMYVANARKMQQVLDAINPALAREVIYAGRPSTMLEIRSAIASGDIVGILADRSPFAERMVSVPFMGRDAAFPVGAYRLAALLGVPAIFACAVVDGDGYAIHFEELPPTAGLDARGAREAWITAAARQFAAHLEKYARRYPANWFNFYDFWEGGVQHPDRAAGRGGA